MNATEAVDNNLYLVEQMITLSKRIRDYREIKLKLCQQLNSLPKYVVRSGNPHNLEKELVTNSIRDYSVLTNYIQVQIEDICKNLKGFPKNAEPVNYISSNDVSYGYVVACNGTNPIVTISLKSGKVSNYEATEANDKIEDKD